MASIDLPAVPRVVQEQAPGSSTGPGSSSASWPSGRRGSPARQPFVTLAQAMAASPEVATAVREFLTERVWARVPAAEDEGKRARIAPGSAQLLGLAWARDIVRMEPLASASRAQVASWACPPHHRGLHHRPSCWLWSSRQRQAVMAVGAGWPPSANGGHRARHPGAGADGPGGLRRFPGSAHGLGPSRVSRMMSAWPACCAVSAMMCRSTRRADHDSPGSNQGAFGSGCPAFRLGRLATSSSVRWATSA